MEDFGYSKEQSENFTSSLIRRAFLIGATLFSIACFIYITISAYSFFSHDNNNIKIIHAQSEPIKIIESNEITPETETMQIDNSIYEDIFGTRKTQKKEATIIKTIEPATPPPPPIPVKKEEIAASTEKEPTQSTPIKQQDVRKIDDQKIIVYSEGQNTQTKTLLKEKPLAKEEKPKKKTRSTVKVQIAALTSKSAANKYFSALQSQHSGLFDDLDPYVQEVDLGKRGIFYRVQVGDFFDQLKAENFCKKYITQTHKSKADCIVVE